MTQPPPSRRNAGSVLFLILIAVVLVAALSWAVSRGSQSSVGQISKEQAGFAAREIISYGNTLTDSVQKLKLRGCNDSEIHFGNDIWSEAGGALIHPAGSGPDHCKIFAIGGGGAQAVTMEPHTAHDGVSTGTGTKRGHMTIYQARVEGIGSAGSADIFLHFPFVRQDVCVEINNLLGIKNPAGQPPVGELSGFIRFNGTFNDTHSLSVPESLQGRPSFCVDTGDDMYRYVQVLISR